MTIKQLFEAACKKRGWSDEKIRRQMEIAESAIGGGDHKLTLKNGGTESELIDAIVSSLEQFENALDQEISNLKSVRNN